MKIKKLISIIIVIMMIPTTAFAGNINIQIDKEPISFTKDSGAPFIDKANRTMVPLRITMEESGCTVDWDGKGQMAVVSKGETVVKVPIGQGYILVNDKKVNIDTSAQIIQGRTFLPIRAVLESFNATVSWNEETKTVEANYESTGSEDDAITVTPEYANDLEVHFIDVGHGDAILVDYGDYEIIIDGGDRGKYVNVGNSKKEKVLSYIDPYIDGDIELMIATHNHADHIYGLSLILEEYNVNTIIISGEVGNTATYKKFMENVNNEPNCNVIEDEDIIITIDEHTLLEIVETGDDYKNTNDNSVISRLVHFNTSVLFTGDMEDQAFQNSKSKFKKTDIVKIPHHSSFSKNSVKGDFYDITQPKVGIITSDNGKKYGHPHRGALEIMFNHQMTCYGTSKSGDIVLVMNKNGYSISPNLPMTIDDAGN